jgi:hypothetical protein
MFESGRLDHSSGQATRRLSAVVAARLIGDVPRQRLVSAATIIDSELFSG